jgi:hypothetical protein
VVHGTDKYLGSAIAIVPLAMLPSATATLRLALPIHIHGVGLPAASAVFFAGRTPSASSASATTATGARLLGLVWSFIHVFVYL